MARISTHVLDIAKGKPAAGIAVELYGGVVTACVSATPMPTAAPMLRCSTADGIPAGIYDCFRAGDYLRPSRRSFFWMRSGFVSRDRCAGQLSCPAAAGAARLQHLSGIMNELADKAIACCRELAQCSAKSLGAPRALSFRRPCATCIACWATGWTASACGLRRCGGQSARTARPEPRSRLLIGSHLDTVPDAGAFDGILGVVLGIALVEVLASASWTSDRSDWLLRRRRRALRHAVHRQPGRWRAR